MRWSGSWSSTQRKRGFAVSDKFSVTVEDGVSESLRRLGTSALKFTVPACEATANNVIAEYRRRVKRDTGETSEGAQKDKLKDGSGYFVSVRNRRMPNLPLWLEAGTKQGKPRSHTQPAAPAFWPAVELEVIHHERRINDAVGEAIVAEGLGS
jgi:hypothetical protein